MSHHFRHLLGSLLLSLASVSLPAQTYSVIHTFVNAKDGAFPFPGLTSDKQGNLYGVARGGPTGNGAVYKLSYVNGGWVFYPLYNFTAVDDGSGPNAALVIGPNGALYGTTVLGGGGPCNDGAGHLGCGTVFKLLPGPTRPASTFGPWIETILYRFQGGSDGIYPEGPVAFDQDGNLYGNTEYGGYYGGFCSGYGCGTVYQLKPSGGNYTESVLYSFTRGTDGAYPFAALAMDDQGNLYGEASGGGQGDYGVVYEMSQVGGNWMESPIHAFSLAEGAGLQSGLIIDSMHNLYGGTILGGPFGNEYGGGVIFELSPSGQDWMENTLHGFPSNTMGPDIGKLLMDKDGNLYGVFPSGGLYTFGEVFELMRVPNGWMYITLYAFKGGSDGGVPYGDLVMDKDGNLYGTAVQGGLNDYPNGYGVVFKIAP